MYQKYNFLKVDELCVATSLVQYRNSAELSDQTIEKMRLHLKKTMEDSIVDKMIGAQLTGTYGQHATFDERMEAKYRVKLGKHTNNYTAAHIDVMVVTHQNRGLLSDSRMEAAKESLVANGVTKEKLEKEDYAPAAICAYVATIIGRQVGARVKVG